MNQTDAFQLFTDGGARGNPGPAGIGYSLVHNNEEIKYANEYIGETTNNVAEYKALIKALTEINQSDLSILALTCKLDSQLVVLQVIGKYKVKQPHLVPLMAEIKSELSKLEKTGCKVNFMHVPRTQNKRADQLVNQAIDAAI